MRARILPALALTCVLASCVQFPKEQLTLDVADQSVPVMLSSALNSSDTLKLSFEAGYNSISVTARATQGGVTTSTTATYSDALNKPLAEQMQVALIQRPAWLEVSSLDLASDRFESFWLSRTKYLLKMDLLAPR